MYTLIEVPDEVKALFARSSTALNQFLIGVSPRETNKLLSITEDLYGDARYSGKIFRLTEGSLSLSINNEVVLVHEEGDLVGIEQIYGLPNSKVSSTFAVRVDEFTHEDILKELSSSKKCREWCEYLTCRLNAAQYIVATLGGGDKNFAPEVRHIPAGEVIINQGSVSTEVYTLLQGHAEVQVDSVKVGEVLNDEIFGALAGLTGMPRTATVVATTDSVLLILEKEKFIDLMQRRPKTVLGLVENMARAVVSLNERVVSLSAANSAVKTPLKVT